MERRGAIRAGQSDTRGAWAVELATRRAAAVKWGGAKAKKR